MVEAGPRGERVRHVDDRHVRMFAQVAIKAASLSSQRGAVPAGEQQRRDRQLFVDRRVLGRRRLLQDDVGVGAADAERRDPGTARPVQLRPGVLGAEQLDRAGRPVDVRGRRVDVQAARQHAVSQGEHHLDQSGDARRGLRVAQVGLDRAEPERLM